MCWGSSEQTHTVTKTQIDSIQAVTLETAAKSISRCAAISAEKEIFRTNIPLDRIYYPSDKYTVTAVRPLLYVGVHFPYIYMATARLSKDRRQGKAL